MISSLPDSPAAKAGLESATIVEKIAGFSTGQMAIGQARLLLTAARLVRW